MNTEQGYSPTIPLTSKPPGGSVPPGVIDWQKRAERAEAELAALKAPREPLPGEIDAEMLRQHNEALEAELAALKEIVEGQQRWAEDASRVTVELEAENEQLLYTINQLKRIIAETKTNAVRDRWYAREKGEGT